MECCRIPQKRVVYLFGAGSTMAEAYYAGIPREEGPSLAHVSKMVIKKAKASHFGEDLREISADETKDIELYISLLESVRIKKYNDMADKFRSLFCKSIQESLTPGGKPVIPVLENALLEMHEAIKKASSLKQKREQANQMANKLLQAVFLQMFGDRNQGDTNQIGFLDIFNVTTGKLNSNVSVQNGQYPFFTCSKETFRINQYSFDCEALLLSGNNAAGEYSVKHYKGKFDAYQRTYILTLKNKEYSYEYFGFLLESKLRELKTISIGTNTKYLTLGLMKNIKLVVPRPELQEAFSEVVKKVERIKNKQLESAQEIDILFNSLMSKAFKGELVTEVA